MKWLANYLIRRAQRTPYTHLSGYMNRWWLVPMVRDGQKSIDKIEGSGPVCWWRSPLVRLLQLCGVAVRVHEILRSDLDRHSHNHPWSYVSVILRGAYFEQQFSSLGTHVKTVHCPPGSVLKRGAFDFHKLVMMSSRPTWTLFITFRKAQSWFFNVGGTYINWRDYKSRKDEVNDVQDIRHVRAKQLTEWMASGAPTEPND